MYHPILTWYLLQYYLYVALEATLWPMDGFIPNGHFGTQSVYNEVRWYPAFQCWLYYEHGAFVYTAME